MGRRFLDSLLFAVIFMFALAFNGGAAFGMKVGFAERDITPKAGMEKPGGYGKSFHKGDVHDPCKIRAAVFDDGKTRVALVGADVILVVKAWINEARQEIYRRCGIAPDAILVGPSHTHSGGPTGLVQPGQFDDASPLVKKLHNQTGINLNNSQISSQHQSY